MTAADHGCNPDCDGSCAVIDENVLQIHPCTEDGHVTLEVMVSPGCRDCDGCREREECDFFDRNEMGPALQKSGFIEDLKVSHQMGYAQGNVGFTRVHVFRSGKVILRKAPGKEEGLKLIDRIVEALLPAVKCPGCNKGRLASDGTCPECRCRVCRVRKVTDADSC